MGNFNNLNEYSEETKSNARVNFLEYLYVNCGMKPYAVGTMNEAANIEFVQLHWDYGKNSKSFSNQCFVKGCKNISTKVEKGWPMICDSCYEMLTTGKINDSAVRKLMTGMLINLLEEWKL